MDDLISRQHAILAIERNAYRREDINETEKVILWVLDIIKWLPSVQPDFDAYCDRLWKLAYERGKRDAQPQRWIPVTEELPDISKFVIVTDSNGLIEIACRMHEGQKIIWWVRDFYGAIQVTAWMPLPEPWRGGQDGKNS